MSVNNNKLNELCTISYHMGHADAGRGFMKLIEKLLKEIQKTTVAFEEQVEYLKSQSKVSKQ